MLTARPESRRPRAVLRAWWPAAGAALLVFAGITFTRADADLWGHLRFGLDILRDRALPAVDPYSFTQDKPWVNHEWLSELVMAVAVTSLGYAGIPLLKGVLAASTVAIVWRSLRGARPSVRVASLVVLLAGTIHATASLRPQLWTLLFLVIECRLLVSGERRRIWSLPVLFALWVNLHGGWIVGLGLFGVWGAVQALMTPVRRLEWIALGCVAFGTTLVNPYGWGLWRFIADTVRLERSIDEWQPLWKLPWAHWIPWFACVVLVVGAARRPFREKWSILAALAMLAWAAARVQRIESLFVAATLVLLAPVLRATWPAVLPRLAYPRARGEGIVAAAAFLVLTASSAAVLSQTLHCVPIRSPWSPDIDAARWLVSARPGRLVTHFNWGQYAIWHFGPRLKVSMDGRRETVYSDARLRDHNAIVEGRDSAFALLETWRPEYVWLPSASRVTRQWLATHGYRIDFEGARSFVAVRDDLPRLIPAREVVSGACFPG